MADEVDPHTQAINEQRNFLAKLKVDFNKQCDEITAKSVEELKSIPETELEKRQEIAQAQKKALDETLAQLKKEIDKSNRETRIKLEEIHNKQVEFKLLELEEMMKDA